MLILKVVGRVRLTLQPSGFLIEDIGRTSDRRLYIGISYTGKMNIHTSYSNFMHEDFATIDQMVRWCYEQIRLGFNYNVLASQCTQFERVNGKDLKPMTVYCDEQHLLYLYVGYKNCIQTSTSYRGTRVSKSIQSKHTIIDLSRNIGNSLSALTESIHLGSDGVCNIPISGYINIKTRETAPRTLYNAVYTLPQASSYVIESSGRGEKVEIF